MKNGNSLIHPIVKLKDVNKNEEVLEQERLKEFKTRAMTMKNKEERMKREISIENN